MSEDKHLEEKEKLEAEIERSLSVAKMKEAHKKIEDIEKLRKQASIKSICERITSCLNEITFVSDMLMEIKNKNSDWKSLFSEKIPESSATEKMLNSIIAIYESICFDLQRTVDIKKEEFDRLFPKIELSFETYTSIPSNLVCLSMRLTDMRNYCLRLI